MSTPDTKIPFLLQEMWLNFLGMELRQARFLAMDGGVWYFPQIKESIMRAMSEAGLSPEDQSQILAELLEFEAQCYATRVGYDMSSFYSSRQVMNFLEQDECLSDIATRLEVVWTYRETFPLVIKSEYNEPRPELEFTANELKQNIEVTRIELQAQFQSELDAWLQRAERYASQINFSNPMINIGMRFRTLEIGFEWAQRYAKRLGKDVGAEIERIRSIAQSVLGYGPYDLQ